MSEPKRSGTEVTEAEIRTRAQELAATEDYVDHPCEIGWARDCLTLIAEIDRLRACPVPPKSHNHPDADED